MIRDGIHITDLQGNVKLDERLIRSAVRRALGSEETGKEVSLAYVEGEKIRELNREHLGHDWETDVIAFPLEDEADSVFGEIVISTTAAVAEAKSRGIEPMVEVLLYTVHGLLHLLGYDDGTPEEAARMRQRESEIIREELKA